MNNIFFFSHALSRGDENKKIYHHFKIWEIWVLRVKDKESEGGERGVCWSPPAVIHGGERSGR